MLDIGVWILKSGLEDARWEKVEHVKRILTGGTYPVPPRQIAVKLIEHMLERGHASGETEDSSGFAKPTIAGKAKRPG